jgi:hypothetical protein
VGAATAGDRLTVAAGYATPSPYATVQYAPPGYVWLPGHWVRNGYGRAWVQGRWVPAQPYPYYRGHEYRPPYRGYGHGGPRHWDRDRYEHDRGGYRR